MSNKTKKKNGKNSKTQKKSNKKLWYGIVIAELVLFVLVLVLFISGGKSGDEKEESSVQSGSSAVEDVDNSGSGEAQDDAADGESKVAETPDFILSAGYNLGITEMASYSGTYYEDGSDEQVADVMMIKVVNYGEEAVQYAEITLTGEAGDALFKLTTLLPGESMTVLEATRKTYAEGDAYATASAANVAYFQQEVSLHEEALNVQALDGGFNITNISEEDITGDIVVYFKNQVDGDLMGGITYRGTIEGGLKAGEIRQVMSGKFTSAATRVMFITVAE